MQRANLANLIKPRHLELIILPTENCNFRCTYCYEDFEIGRMEDRTVYAIKKLIDSRLRNLDSLTISWFGGEPLMAKDIVMDINRHAMTVAAKSGVHFSSNATTNAYSLNKATFHSLIQLGLNSYQISLDGDKVEHDKTRKLANSKGTFLKIWQNLLSMKESNLNFSILLRIHVHLDNLISVKDLLSRINNEFGMDVRFNIFLKAVGNWGGEGVKKMNLTKTASQDVITDLAKHLEIIGWNTPRSYSNESPSIHVCYAALPTSFVIRADGNLAKCTVAFNDPRNVVGKINDDGTLYIENEAMHGFMRGFKNLNSDELRCPIQGMPAKAQPISFYPAINK